MLAKYPEEQQRLYDEIYSVLGADTQVYFYLNLNLNINKNNLSLVDYFKNLNSDSVQKLEYLDMFIKEVLRMYPIANS